MPPPNRNARVIVIVAGLLGIVIGGYFTGRALSTRLTDQAGTTTPVSRSPTKPRPQSAPLPVGRAPRAGFARSREGAGGAAATYAMALANVALADRTVREKAYRQITTRRARTGLLALAQSSQAVLQRNLAGGPGPVVLRVAPLGYRIVTFTPSQAVVDIWTVGIGGGRARQPTASFGSTLITLQWQQGRWRLDAFQNQPGLTPAPAPMPANPGDVLADQDKYRTFATVTP